MSSFAELIEKAKKDWGCPELMDSYVRTSGNKIPFSSPLLQYSTYGGIPRQKITEFCGAPGGGKAQPLYSKILTPEGFITMGEVKEGNVILDGKGKVCKVTGIYPQGKRKIYEIITELGYKIRVADNHLNCVWWFNENGKYHECFIWETTELIKNFNSGKYKNLQVERLCGGMMSEYAKIKSVSYIGEEICQCIMVDSNEHTYISDNYIVTHNTTTAVDICKNAVELFKNEHIEKLSALRQDAGTSKKANLEFEELQDRGPKKVLYVDLEHSFDSAWAETLGVNRSEINIMQPPDVFAEQILQMLQDMIETDEVGLIVLDSLPSLVPQQELEKKFGERTVAAQAGLLTIFCRKIVPKLTRYDTTMIFINQIRDNMDNPYVIKTPGGEAPKFYASLRILFQIGKPIDFLGNELPNNAEDPAGYIINAKILKQKSAPNDRKASSYYLMSNSGIRIDMDYAQLALKKYGLIKKAAAWFTFIDPETGELLEDADGKTIKINGMAKVYDFLKTNKEYFNKLKTYIQHEINGEEPEVNNESEHEIL